MRRLANFTGECFDVELDSWNGNAPLLREQIEGYKIVVACNYRFRSSSHLAIPRMGLVSLLGFKSIALLIVSMVQVISTIFGIAQILPDHPFAPPNTLGNGFVDT